MINEKEFEIVNILATGAADTQRELAIRAKISLGMVNILLKRLVTKGYLRVQQLDNRKIKYILTARGFSEKLQKSYRYTLKTISSVKTIRTGLQQILEHEYAGGSREFVIVGDGDINDLAEIALRSLGHPDISYMRLPRIPANLQADSLLLVANGDKLPKAIKNRSLHLTKSLADVITTIGLSRGKASHE